MCMERRRFSQTIASEWQNVFVVCHKMPWCALFTAVKNYNKSLENCKTFFFKTETKTKTKCSRPRPSLHDPRPRPRLSFLSSRRLETKTMVSRTTSLEFSLLLFFFLHRSNVTVDTISPHPHCVTVPNLQMWGRGLVRYKQWGPWISLLLSATFCRLAMPFYGCPYTLTLLDCFCALCCTLDGI